MQRGVIICCTLLLAVPLAAQALRLQGNPIRRQFDQMSDFLFSEHKEKGLQLTHNALLPKCYEPLEIDDLLNATWCSPKYAPNGKAPPKKLQGLYWMQWDEGDDIIGQPMFSDMFVCMSTSEYDYKTHTMRMETYKQFVYRDSMVGTAFAFGAAPKNAGAHYECTFQEPIDNKTAHTASACQFNTIATDGMAAKITEFNKKSGLNSLSNQLNFYMGMLPNENTESNFGATAQYVGGVGSSDRPMWLKEVTGSEEEAEHMPEWLKGKKVPPGEVWDRITYIANSDNVVTGERSHHYKWIRIMDGDMNVRKTTFLKMKEFFKEKDALKAVRYTDKC